MCSKQRKSIRHRNEAARASKYKTRIANTFHASTFFHLVSAKLRSKQSAGHLHHECVCVCVCRGDMGGITGGGARREGSWAQHCSLPSSRWGFTLHITGSEAALSPPAELFNLHTHPPPPDESRFREAACVNVCERTSHQKQQHKPPHVSRLRFY